MHVYILCVNRIQYLDIYDKSIKFDYVIRKFELLVTFVEIGIIFYKFSDTIKYLNNTSYLEQVFMKIRLNYQMFSNLINRVINNEM